MEYRVTWSPEAVEDFESIAEYIERDSSFYAQSVVSQILAGSRNIEEFPLKWVRSYRIIKRAFGQLISGPKLYLNTITNHFELIVFNHNYERIHHKPTLKILKKFDDKVVICNSYKEAMCELNM